MGPTKLAGAIVQGAAAAKPTAARRLQAALAGKRPMKPITVPVFGVEVDAVMTVIGSERHLDIEAEVAQRMEQRGLEQNVLNQGRYELDEAWHVLAEAVLESEANPVPIGTPEDWGKLTPEIIGHLWTLYSELRAEHDPSTVSISKDEAAQIRDAVSKKNAMLLRYFGVQKLAAWLTTSDDLLASSSIETSSPGGLSSIS